MEEMLDDVFIKPTGKVYKDKALWVGTFLGGPLVAAYFFAENFKVLNENEKVRPTWIIAIISTILILSGVMLIPDEIDIPNQIIPIIYTAIAFGLFKQYQDKNIIEHISMGGQTHGWGRIVGIGILGAVVTLASLFIVITVVHPMEEAEITTKTYGTTAKHEIDFDASNIPETEVDKIANGFIEAGFFDLVMPKFVHVVKADLHYEISISVVPGTENDTEAIEEFVNLREQMDTYLPEHTVEFKLVVHYLDNVVKVLK